ncbi:hypothetical protein [Gilliamella sp. Occ4-3]|nr:hypothetical protein [Gilliamella apicola]
MKKMAEHQIVAILKDDHSSWHDESSYGCFLQNYYNSHHAV